MRGQKKRRKRTIGGEATVNDTPLVWQLISEPQWSNSGDGYKGLCISVNVTDTARRELIIEYPFPTGKDGRPLPVPQRPNVSAKAIERDISLALSAGWDPGSRGKAFIFYPEAQSE